MALGMGKYFIYDPNAKDELGGHRIEKDDDGKQFVMMTHEQASYWLQMMAIGREDFSALPADRQKRLNTMWGGKLIPKEEPPPTGG